MCLVLTLTILFWTTPQVEGQYFREFSLQEGGDIMTGEEVTIHEYETPVLVKNHIFVREGAKLTLEPGVELRFAPGVMLAVNGTLVAKV